MGSGATKAPKAFSVEVLTSELGGVPGFKAYHTSIVLGGTEYAFSDVGIESSTTIQSHGERRFQRLDFGKTTLSGDMMLERLRNHFAPGSYDLLRKNCNSFSDAALVLLVDKRLDERYRHLEKLGARHMQVVSRITGQYAPNPRADDFNLESLCTDLKFNRSGPAWATSSQKIGDDLDGQGRLQEGQTGSQASGKRRPLKRVQILPFQDAFELNFNHMYEKYILPHVQSSVIADTESGRGLRTGEEFSARGGRVRFRVVSCDPPEGGYPTAETIVVCEGDPIERQVLTSVSILPLESSMGLLAGKKANDLAREFVSPFLEHYSSHLHMGEILTIKGVRFKVVSTAPASGGGASFDTKLNTFGPPVKVCGVPGCEEPIAKWCREKGCKLPVCLQHAADVNESSCLCPTHAPPPKKSGWFRGR